MGDDALWAVLIGHCGREVARVPFADTLARDALPLRDLANEGLRLDAAALVIVRLAADSRCMPCAQEAGAINAASRTLHAIGMRLHDYIMWHGETCVSLRLKGQI